MVKGFVMAMLALWLNACTSLPSPQERQAHADVLAAARGWRPLPIPAGPFDLRAYLPHTPVAGDVLTIYIEGDGFAWLSGSTPSADPTPRDPVGLRLALAHPTGNAAYLARPCQYVDAEAIACPQRYWTEARFAPEVVDATNRAIAVLKQRFGARRLVLIGYSGGGAIAALLAARRNDVERLVTVAGNLDHASWTTHHRVRPLTGSLNAVDDAERLTGLQQTHFVGGRDKVIPPELAYRLPQALLGQANRNLRVEAEFDHACCWVKQWPALLDSAMR